MRVLYLLSFYALLQSLLSFCRLGSFAPMAAPIWTSSAEELASEQDQIPPQKLAVGHIYHVLPCQPYSQSNFFVRLRERQGEYLSLINELAETKSHFCDEYLYLVSRIF